MIPTTSAHHWAILLPLVDFGSTMVRIKRAGQTGASHYDASYLHRLLQK